jgi:pimeloyl-ACP methyl ester carboxylesterase
MSNHPPGPTNPTMSPAMPGRPAMPGPHAASTTLIDVRGGSGGILADCDDLAHTAGLFGSAGLAAAEAALRMHGVLVESDLAASTLLDPAGAAVFSAALLFALDGPSGLVEIAAACATTGLALRGSAASYVAADRLQTDLAAPLEAVRTLPRAAAGLIDDELHGQWAGGLNTFLTDDPQLVDVFAAITQSFVAPAVAGQLYPDGQPVVTHVTTGAAPPPRDIQSVVAGIASLDDDRVDGEVTVQILTGTDSGGYPTRRVIVDIPGTGDWDLARLRDPDVTDMGTSLRALAGEQTTYEAGVLAAMRAAGVRPSDDVLLVGHSQGGIVAVDAARHAMQSGEFNITHVITAGAPIGGTVGALPASVQILALENEGDIVPEVDGRPNPDRPNITTVTVHHDQGAVGPDHDLQRSYVPGAADVDASDDPSVRTYVQGMRGFLDADQASTSRFLITRALS